MKSGIKLNDVGYGVFVFMGLLVLLSFGNCFAASTQQSSVGAQYSSVTSRSDVVILGKSENYLISENDRFMFNSGTTFKSLNSKYELKRLIDLPVPCVVNLSYIKYYKTTELEPFPAGTKVLKNVSFVKKSNADVSQIPVFD